METWLLLAAAVFLAGVGAWLWVRSRAVRRGTGLPSGRVVYVDTGAWNRCEKPLFSETYRLVGRPDYLVESRQGVFPVEVKSGKAPSRPYPTHILQLAAYCLLVEEQEHRTPTHGILKYSDRAVAVDYTPALRARLLATLDEMRRGLVEVDVERNHDDLSRCRACGFRDGCNQRLE